MKIVADNREKKRGNYDDFVLVKRFERGERERERDLQQPHCTRMRCFFFKKRKVFSNDKKRKTLS
jgi:hypothetical protein